MHNKVLIGVINWDCWNHHEHWNLKH